MRIVRCTMLLAMFVALGSSTRGEAPNLSGTWRLSYLLGFNEGTLTQRLELEQKDGRLSVKSSGMTPQSQMTLSPPKIVGDTLEIGIKNPVGQYAFLGRIRGDNPNSIKGVYRTEQRTYPAELTRVVEGAPTARSAMLQVPPMKRYAELASQQSQAMFRIGNTKDAEARKELSAKSAEAAKALSSEGPKLLREIVEKHGDSPAALFAATQLIRTAKQAKATPEDVREWAAKATKAAEAYGPLYVSYLQFEVAELLTAQPEYGSLALEFAKKAEKSLSDKDSADQQIRVLTVLNKALKSAGNTEEMKPIGARLAKLESVLDKEYLAKVPPFKPEPFAGRKGKGTGPVVMELFTGAQCPPCVAADVAFDALQKSYKPTDLILIQYHVHIPGPDPLTNADTEARFAHYRKVHTDRKQIGGTPSTLFNGQPKAYGGGGMANAENKYKQYTDIINPLLEEEAGAKVTGSASLRGGKLDIKVKVADLAEPGDQKKLRLLLVEETVKYTGSNKLRFHHQVVRAMAGGVEGFALGEKTSSHSATIDLKELRGKLNGYLDDFAAKRPFPKEDRPLDLKNLRVIALVQDDKDMKILGAVQIEVPDEVAAK